MSRSLRRAVVVSAKGEFCTALARVLAQGAHEAVLVADVDQAVERVLQGGVDCVLLTVDASGDPGDLETDAALLRFCGFTGPVLAVLVGAAGAVLPIAATAATCPAGIDALLSLPSEADRFVRLVRERLGGAAAVSRDTCGDFSRVPGYAALRRRFALTLPITRERLRRLVGAADIEALRRELHVLKGNAGTFGLQVLSVQSQRALALFRAERPADALGVCGALMRRMSGARQPARHGHRNSRP